MDLGLDGDSALCTASTSGLGLASAETLAAEGANVAVCGRSEDRLEEARETLEAAGSGDVVAMQVDITDPDDVAAFVTATAEEFGGIDHVVTSAGGPPPGTFLETTERDWYSAYDLLVMSVYWTIQEAHSHLEASDDGSIVAITSRTVVEPVDGLVLSNAVRKAVIGLVKTLSREFAPGVRVNAVLPGTIETPRVAELVEAGIERGDYDSYQDGLDEWADDIPMGRIGDPGEFGDVVAYLSSERASYVNGIAMPIDGGQIRS